MERFLTVALLLAGCGGPALACPEPGLPSPDPTYTDTVASLVVVPTRGSLRDASAAERESFRAFVVAHQQACDASPPTGDCTMTHLRAALVALPAPDHPAVFTDIDGALDAALDRARGDFAPADRDCDGQPEETCDARGVTRAFARAACALGE
ncbi:MAG: hypothetical protein VYE22_05290 [Myxococcota bacterium]|nr:hypothetical protein [Myxococcota bacterium]